MPTCRQQNTGKQPAGEKEEEVEEEVQSLPAVSNMFGFLNVFSTTACDGQQGRIQFLPVQSI